MVLIMNYFNENNLKKLKAILDSWLKTPYRHQCGVKGAGCDCIHLIARVLEEMSFGPFKIPEYSRDWHLHKTDQILWIKLLNELKRTGISFIQINAKNEEPVSGDVVLYKFGKALSHCAFYYEKEIYHAVNDLWVLKTPYNDKMWFKRREQILRITNE